MKKNIFAVLVLVLLLALSDCTNEDLIYFGNLKVNYWDLPTGSRIAYLHIPSKDNMIKIPLVFLHGGPGAYEIAGYMIGQRWYDYLSGLGYDIYLYDQAGSGYSQRLKDPVEYTVKRHIEDLEAIRKTIGNRKLVLIGDSWGASLAANYMAAYPENVSRVVFTSPGAIDLEDWSRKSSTPKLMDEFLKWIESNSDRTTYEHCLKLNALLKLNVKSAYSFAGDKEMDELTDNFIREKIYPLCVSNPQRMKEMKLKPQGFGFWSMSMTIWDAVNKKEPVKTKLTGSQTPVLILRGDSDYLPEQIAIEYSILFTNSKLVRIPSAGHFIWIDQPLVYTKQIDSFLKNR